MCGLPSKDLSDDRDEPLASEDEVEHEDDSVDVELWRAKLVAWEAAEEARKAFVSCKTVLAYIHIYIYIQTYINRFLYRILSFCTKSCELCILTRTSRMAKNPVACCKMKSGGIIIKKVE